MKTSFVIDGNNTENAVIRWLKEVSSGSQRGSATAFNHAGANWFQAGDDFVCYPMSELLLMEPECLRGVVKHVRITGSLLGHDIPQRVRRIGRSRVSTEHFFDGTSGRAKVDITIEGPTLNSALRAYARLVNPASFSGLAEIVTNIRLYIAKLATPTQQ